MLNWEDDFGNTLLYEGTFFYNCLHGTGKYNWHGRGAYTGKVLSSTLYLVDILLNYELLKRSRNDKNSIKFQSYVDS